MISQERSDSVRKIYLVETNNSGMHEDYYTWIDGAFKSYRSATQYLLDEGFDVYFEWFMGQVNLCFYREGNDDMSEYNGANILEIELKD